MSIDRKYPLTNDTRLKSILEAIYNSLDALEARPTTVALSASDRSALVKQAANQAAGLLGAFAQPVLGQVGDPLLTNVGTSNGSVTSFSAGDLSPLFTTTEANVTTTPSLSFAQIVQNANLIFAGPSSGAATNPTFRALTAIDIQTIGATLLASTSLNLNTNTKQALYTVPPGKSAIVIEVVLRSPSKDLSTGVTLNVSFGFDAGALNWANPAFGTPALTLASQFVAINQFAVGGGGSGPSTIGTAAQVFGAITDAAFGSAATVIADIVGYLF